MATKPYSGRASAFLAHHANPGEQPLRVGTLRADGGWDHEVVNLPNACPQAMRDAAQSQCNMLAVDAAHELLLALAKASTARYPQYERYWDGWGLAKLRKDWRGRKTGVGQVAGDYVLYRSRQGARDGLPEATCWGPRKDMSMAVAPADLQVIVPYKEAK